MFSRERYLKPYIYYVQYTSCSRLFYTLYTVYFREILLLACSTTRTMNTSYKDLTLCRLLRFSICTWKYNAQNGEWFWCMQKKKKRQKYLPPVEKYRIPVTCLGFCSHFWIRCQTDIWWNHGLGKFINTPEACINFTTYRAWVED